MGRPASPMLSLFAGLIAGCTVQAAANADVLSVAGTEAPMTAEEMKDIRGQIARHWLADIDPPCHGKLTIEIELAEDGTVRRAEGLNDFTLDQVCAAAQSAALRAVWSASPLKLPSGKYWPTIDLVFDPHLTM